MQIRETRKFIEGGINLDVDPSLLPDNHWLDMLNGVVDEELGSITNMKGTRSRGYGLYPGLPGYSAKAIGRVEEKGNNALIYFVAIISSGVTVGSYIIKYDPATTTSTLVCNSSNLSFDADYPITHANVIDGLLYWTDGLNPPRKLNIQKAINHAAGSGSPAYSSITEQVLSAAKYAPGEAPAVSYGTDGDRVKNNVRSKQFQFCYRWIYEDNEKSATSPISKIALPTVSEVGGVFADDVTIDNYISVYVQEGTELVKTVEIFAREGNDGRWGRVAKLNKEDYSILDSETGVYEFLFYNDDILGSVDQDEINRINDSAPILADTQDIVDDGTMVYGGVTEGREGVAPNVSIIVKPVEIDFSEGDGSTTQAFVLDNNTSNVELDLDSASNPLPSAGDVLVFDFRSDSVAGRIGYYQYSGQFYIPGSAVEDKDSFMDFIVRSVPDGALEASIIRSSNTVRFTWKGGIDFVSAALTTEGASASIGKQRGFKWGSTHPLGIVYFDKQMRHSGVSINDDLFIDVPFYTSQYYSGVASGGDTTNVSVSGSPWTNDELLNKYIVITGGAASGDIRRIAFNASGFLTVDTAFSAAISATDTFIIQNGYIRSRPTFLWQIKHQPPDWAHYWAWVYGGNRTVESWTQYVIADDNDGDEGSITQFADGGGGKVVVTSSSHGLSDNDIVVISGTTNYNGTFVVKKATTDTFEIEDTWVSDDGTGTWSKVYNAIFDGVGDYENYTFVNIRALNQHLTIGNSDTVYPNSSINSYTWNKGDRVRFITQQNTSGPSSAPIGEQVTEYLDFEILGYKDNDPATDLLVIDQFNHSSYNIGDNSLVEIYTPRLGVEEELYYGMGETYEIGNAGLSTRYHEGETDDQDPSDLSGTPAKGILTDGDAYYYNRSFSVDLYLTNNTDIIESENMSDLYESDSYCKGKAFIILDNPQQKKYNFLRWSNKYFPDTQINGLSKFESANRTKQLNSKYGEIKKIEEVGITLRVIQERKTSVIYIGRTFIQSEGDVDGQLTTINQTLGTIRPSQAEYGTIFPNSVCSHGSWTYFYDIHNGCICRLANNGVFKVSDYGIADYIREKSDTLLSSGVSNVDVISEVDRKHNTFIITFLDASNSSNNETWMFYEPWNRWVSRASFKPEMYGRVGDILFSLTDGNLYEHDYYTSQRGRFYGTYYPFELKVSSNLNPLQIKLIQAIGLDTDNNRYDSDNPTYGWSIPEIWVPESGQYPSGQFSKLSAANFKDMHDRLYSEVFRNMYTYGTPGSTRWLRNGAPMQGDHFQLQLTHSKPTKVILSGIDIWHIVDQIS